MRILLFFLFITVAFSKDPIALSNIDTNVAKVKIESGHKDGDIKDDIITSEIVVGDVIFLTPTQKTLVSDKVLSFILAHLANETWLNLEDMDAVVSNDDPPAIMDGHHKWAAAITINPNMKVKYIKINLTKNKLITVLNTYTVGKLNITKGKPSTGESIEQAFINLESKINNAYDNGINYGKTVYSAEKVKLLMSKVPGANGDSLTGKQILINNSKHNKIVKVSATELLKEEMPIIEKENIPQLINDLNDGKIDINEPFYK